MTRVQKLIDVEYPEQYYFGITNHGLNRIAEEEGLGASLIRPRREYPPTPNKPVISPHNTAQTNPHHSVRSNGSGKRDEPEPKAGMDTGTGDGEVVDVDMEELTKGMSKLESSLTFVPSQVRRKGKGKAKAGAGNGNGVAVEGSGDAATSMPMPRQSPEVSMT